MQLRSSRVLIGRPRLRRRFVRFSGIGLDRRLQLLGRVLLYYRGAGFDRWFRRRGRGFDCDRGVLRDQR
ncbi:MAG TPA: hypothetical protein VGZ51_07350, partial [Actinomycetota bacterium]|nr:hypothetical protein [Actinomycetota bacterium]